MKFQLVGNIGYDVGSCHDGRSVSVDEEFEAATHKEAISKAKETVQRYHKQYSYHTDYGFAAELRIVTPIWKTYFQGELSAQPAVPEKIQPAKPARPARPAIPAHFEEQELI